MKVKNAYNNIADKWDNYRNQTKINKCIVDFTKLLKPNSHILDIGCGTGYPISSYLDNNYQVTGIDISDKMINKAKELNLKNCNFSNIDFLDYQSDTKYDAIIAFDSLWHIPYNKQELIYSKLASLLNKNGYLLFTHGNKDSEITGTMFNEEFYYSALDYNKVKELLETNDFRILEAYNNYKEESTGARDLLVIAIKKQ